MIKRLQFLYQEGFNIVDIFVFCSLETFAMLCSKASPVYIIKFI